MDQRTRKSPARFLAPLALIAFVIVMFAVVSGSGGSDSDKGDQTATKTAATKKQATSSKKTPKTGTTQTGTPTGPASYTVKVGDTLGGIADATGVSLARIQELNPKVDSSSLTVGQKIKLR